MASCGALSNDFSADTGDDHWRIDVASVKKIVDSLFLFLKKNKKDEIPDIFSDQKYPIRQHHRHLLGGFGIGKLSPIAEVTFQLGDISYGGVGILANEVKLRPFTNRHRQFIGMLDFVGLRASFTLELVFLDPAMIGCKFVNMTGIHESFLQGFITYMDAGVTARRLDSNKLPEIFRSSEWVSFGNRDGTMEVHVKLDQRQQSCQVSVAYVVKGVKYYAIISGDKSTVGTAQGRELNDGERIEVLRTVIAILIGLNQHTEPHLVKDAILHAYRATQDNQMLISA